MRPIPAEPPPFFRRGPSALARVTFFGLASIVLLFVDARFRYLEDVRQAAGAILFAGLAWFVTLVNYLRATRPPRAVDPQVEPGA